MITFPPIPLTPRCVSLPPHTSPLRDPYKLLYYPYISLLAMGSLSYQRSNRGPFSSFPAVHRASATLLFPNKGLAAPHNFFQQLAGGVAFL